MTELEQEQSDSTVESLFESVEYAVDLQQVAVREKSATYRRLGQVEVQEGYGQFESIQAYEFVTVEYDSCRDVVSLVYHIEPANESEYPSIMAEQSERFESPEEARSRLESFIRESRTHTVQL